MTTGGMTPAERLKAKSGEYYDARHDLWKNRPRVISPLWVAVGAVASAAGFLMFAMGANEWLSFPIFVTGGVLMLTFGYRQDNRE